jgi:hypothetical protein
MVILDAEDFNGRVQVERQGDRFLVWFGKLARVYLDRDSADTLNTELGAAFATLEAEEAER